MAQDGACTATSKASLRPLRLVPVSEVHSSWTQRGSPEYDTRAQGFSLVFSTFFFFPSQNQNNVPFSRWLCLCARLHRVYARRVTDVVWEAKSHIHNRVLGVWGRGEVRTVKGLCPWIPLCAAI